MQCTGCGGTTDATMIPSEQPLFRMILICIDMTGLVSAQNMQQHISSFILVGRRIFGPITDESVEAWRSSGALEKYWICIVMSCPCATQILLRKTIMLVVGGWGDLDAASA